MHDIRSQVLSHERSEWLTLKDWLRVAALASDRIEQIRYYLQ